MRWTEAAACRRRSAGPQSRPRIRRRMRPRRQHPVQPAVRSFSLRGSRLMMRQPNSASFVRPDPCGQALSNTSGGNRRSQIGNRSVRPPRPAARRCARAARFRRSLEREAGRHHATQAAGKLNSRSADLGDASPAAAKAAETYRRIAAPAPRSPRRCGCEVPTPIEFAFLALALRFPRSRDTPLGQLVPAFALIFGNLSRVLPKCCHGAAVFRRPKVEKAGGP